MTIQNDFLKACKNNDLEKVKALLDNYDFDKKCFGKGSALFSESLNPADSDNEALRWAAGNGHLDVVGMLLQIDEVKNNAAACANEALRMAAQNGHADIVRMLLQIDEVKNNAATINNSALRWAISNGHVDIVRMLLEIEAVKTIHSNEPLKLATKHGHIDIVRILLKIDEVKNNAAAVNNLALRLALEYGHVDIIRMLLEIESVKNNAAVYHNKALRVSAQKGYTDIVEILLNIDKVRNNASALDNEALIMAAQNGHIEVVRILLEIDEVRNNGVLEWAVQNGLVEVVNLLIENPFVFKQLLSDYLNGTLSLRAPNKLIVEAIDKLYLKQILIQNTLPLPIEEQLSPELFGSPDLDQLPAFKNKKMPRINEMVTVAILNAAQSNHEGIFRFLLSNPSVRKYFTLIDDITHKNTLNLSVITGNLKAVKLLLEIAEIRSIFKNNYTQLRQDAINNKMSDMQVFLENTYEKLNTVSATKRNEPEHSNDDVNHSAKKQGLRQNSLDNEAPAATPLLPKIPLVTPLYQSATQPEKRSLNLELSDEVNSDIARHQDKKQRRKKPS